MLSPNISAFLFVGVVTFVIVGSQANLLKIQVNETIESTSNRHKRYSHDDMFPVAWRRGSIFEEREIVKKTYSCANDEFQHEEGSSGKWEKKDITYFIESFGTSMSEEDVRRGIESAFSHWADTIDLTFTEVNDSDAADIVFGFKSGEHGDNFPFKNGYAAENVQMAHCVGKMPCTAIHFDDDQSWRYVQWESAINERKW
uniref:Peptidase M10 metallopeptidase domain-containing protein n=1 Tax=Acrobeloides nanus TaxID=290746 RepID=A0A914D844_9BILA